jgi:hypothetical protein
MSQVAAEMPPAGVARATVRRFLDSVWAPMLIGAAIRLSGLDRLSFWLDETTSVRIARQPFAAIWQDVGDTHPPLYHLLLHAWLLGGTSEAWVRLLSALLGIATIPALYALGRVLVGRRVALGAAWLLALLPWHIWYSQEARMYAAVGLLGVLSLLAGACWLRQAGPGWGAAYVLATVTGIYCEYSMFLLWPAMVIALPALVLRPTTGWGQNTLTTNEDGAINRAATPNRALESALRRRPRGRAAAAWLGLQLAVLVGIVPLNRFFAAHFPIFASPEFLQMRFGALTPFLGLIAVVGGAGAWAAVLATRRWGRAHPAATDRLIRAAWIALLVAAVGLMLIPGGMTAKRVLLITAPLICLGGAWALVQQPTGPRGPHTLKTNEDGAINRAATHERAPDAALGGWAGRGLLAVLAASAVAVAVMFVTVPKEPWREVVAAIHAAAAPGDIVLLAPAWTTVPFDYYDGGGLPRIGVAPADLPALAARLGQYRRAWLILAQDQVIDPQGQVPSWVATRYPLNESRAYYQIQVQLYILPGP